MKLKPALTALSLLLPLASLAGKPASAPPVAEKKAVVDTYHDTKVEDPYQ